MSATFQVRATNLQELVYKNGQAGITKASVSITFDNSDPDQCPFGYNQYDEIVVTRQVGSVLSMWTRNSISPLIEQDIVIYSRWSSEEGIST
mgnify:CR=1 FL=1